MAINNSKIFNLDELKKKIFLLKKKGKKIVHCHGVFDLIHVGHIKHFSAAKKYGDFLLVSLTADKFVNKGVGKPLFNQDLRAEVISSLEKIDAVYINDFNTSINLINIIKPSVYFKGPDYKNLKKDKTGNIIKEINAVKKNGGKVFFSKDIKFSSSKLINNNYEIFNPDQKNFLNTIKKKYNFDFIVKKINDIKKHNVFLIGEVIVDRYIFGEVLGKSGKEPHLVIQKTKQEQYLGGSGAIANHLSTFVNKITFLSTIGDNKDLKNFISKSLKKNISQKFLKINNNSTILKSRFIDNITGNKLLGVYNLDSQILKKKIENKIHNIIENHSYKNDLILISDYGHGMISSATAKKLVQQKNFLCLNAQVNASNIGYHSLRKYKKIATLIINENELRHEMRDKLNKIENLSQKLSNIYNIKNLVITRGKKGAILLHNKNKFYYCPAFAGKIMDKVGAGDAMLAIISLCLKAKIPLDLALFISSLAAATVVENMGNSKFITKNELLRQIEYLIK